MTSAAFSARTAFSVKSSGSPGPAPTKSTRPCTACAFTAASIASPTRRRASLSSPASAASLATPSNTPSQNLRRGRPPGSFRRRRRGSLRQDGPEHRDVDPARARQGAQSLGEHWRGAFGADSNCYLAAIEMSGIDEAAQSGLVGNIDGHAESARAIAATRASSASSPVAAMTNGRPRTQSTPGCTAMRATRPARSNSASSGPKPIRRQCRPVSARFSRSRAFWRQARRRPSPKAVCGRR